MPREIRITEAAPGTWVISLFDEKHPLGVLVPVHLRDPYEAGGFVQSVEVCARCECLSVGACTCSPEAYDCLACEQIEATGRTTVAHVTGRSCALALPADCADAPCADCNDSGRTCATCGAPGALVGNAYGHGPSGCMICDTAPGLACEHTRKVRP